jgi:hypothetical protein
MTPDMQFENLKRIVAQLQDKSAFVRTDFPDGSWELTPKLPGERLEKLSMSLLTDPEHSDVKAFNALINDTFDPAECDSLEGTQEFVRSNADPERFQQGQYIGILVKNEQAQPIALVNGDYIPTKDSSGQLTGAGVLAVGYIIVDGKYRGLGLSRDLYCRTLEMADQAARDRNQLLVGMIGESVPMLEVRVNKTLEMMARRRIYTKNGAGAMVESQYIQPPLEPNGDIAPEHLLYGAVDGAIARAGALPLDLVVQGVRALYERFAGWNHGAPDGVGATMWTEHQQQLSELFSKFETSLRENSCDGLGYLISRQDRKQRIKQGEVFLEHFRADHLQETLQELAETKQTGAVQQYDNVMNLLIVDVDPNPVDLEAALQGFSAEIRAEIHARM